MTNISQSFTDKMAMKTSWYRYESKLRHCHQQQTHRVNEPVRITTPCQRITKTSKKSMKLKITMTDMLRRNGNYTVSQKTRH